jgi:hypothetical protein
VRELIVLNLSPWMASYKLRAGQRKIRVRLRVRRVDKSTFRPCCFNGHKKADEHAV